MYWSLTLLYGAIIDLSAELDWQCQCECQCQGQGQCRILEEIWTAPTSGRLEDRCLCGDVRQHFARVQVSGGREAWALAEWEIAR
ncbi:hypothetical protein BDV18DRAFT_138926 [Aspergillus unguis]